MALTNAHIVELIENRTTYKPGWRFACNGDGYGHVEVTIMWDQLETNPDNIINDAGEWGVLKSPNSEYFTINRDDVVDETDVLRVLLEHCLLLEAKMLQHEAREFLRVKPRMEWAAPFHPHHRIGDGHEDGKNGKDNWRKTMHRQLEANETLPDL